MGGIAESLSVLKQAIDLRAQRQQVLASNVANADTPGYKARDFDFQSAMSQSMAGQSGGLALATTSGRHLGTGLGSSEVALQYRKETQSAVDGNTVDMDVERSAMTDNAMQYEVLTKLITDRLQSVKSAMATTSS